MEKVRIGYSSSKEIKDYLEQMAEKYNMTVSGVLTMIIMQHKFQNETLEKFENMQEMINKIQNADMLKNLSFSKQLIK